MNDPDQLITEDFDLAATRPATGIGGLPYALEGVLMLAGFAWLGLFRADTFLRTTVGDVLGLGVIGIVWSVVKATLATDYHGWGNAVAWMRLDARCLDARERGGVGLSTFPQRSIYRAGAGDA